MGSERRRRFDNPEFTRQTDDDPIRAAQYAVDRVEALSYAAERYGSKMFSFIHAGARLLGRDFRAPEILQRMAAEGPKRDRKDAMAALALLGQPGPEAEWGSVDSSEELERLLYRGLLLQDLDVAAMRKAAKRLNSVRARDLSTEAVLAARTGRWLLQR